MSDYEALVRKAQSEQDDARRQEAFGQLVEQFQDAVLHWTMEILGDYEQAQDAAQEAFMTAYRSLDTLREPKAFPVWLKRIAYSQCSRITRCKRLSVKPLDEENDLTVPVYDPAQVVEEREIKRRVQQAITDLPEHERVVTELFYLTGYSQNEIAERLRLPLTTVKKRLQYARERLKERLPQHDIMCALRPAGFDSPELKYGWPSSPFVPLSIGYAASLSLAGVDDV